MDWISRKEKPQIEDVGPKSKVSFEILAGDGAICWWSQWQRGSPAWSRMQSLEEVSWPISLDSDQSKAKAKPKRQGRLFKKKSKASLAKDKDGILLANPFHSCRWQVLQIHQPP